MLTLLKLLCLAIWMFIMIAVIIGSHIVEKEEKVRVKSFIRREI
ncbi:hypothetical protein [Thermosyntropha sp.]|nr:hypothetical protein [Thermosyntropha sp.]